MSSSRGGRGGARGGRGGGRGGSQSGGHSSSRNKPLKKATATTATSSSATTTSAESASDYWSFSGYFGIHGPVVTKAGNSDVESVPAAYIEQRKKRDGEGSHITLLLKRDLKTAVEGAEKVTEYEAVVKKLKEKKLSDIDFMMELISEVVVDDWKDLGLGKVKQGDNEAYFKVVQWPSASAFLKNVGLADKHFHITVGFKVSDIHDVPKDERTLVTK